MLAVNVNCVPRQFAPGGTCVMEVTKGVTGAAMFALRVATALSTGPGQAILECNVTLTMSPATSVVLEYVESFGEGVTGIPFTHHRKVGPAPPLVVCAVKFNGS